MKCIKAKATEIVMRVPNDEAAKFVASGMWRYASKSEWRRYIAEHEPSNKRS